MNDSDIERLQALLDALPPPAEPLDVSMLDGYLCGVLLQPRRVALDAWLPTVFDASEAAPTRAAPPELVERVARRHAELDAAIERRGWFDPWVFELDAPEEADATPVDAVYPWVAGFALAMERFPALMELDAAALLEPLALLYRHVAPDDLEDADELLELIDSLEPPQTLDDAVEGLVQATLLLADVSRPTAPSSRRHRVRRR